jgi:hypothetical protein
MGSEEKAPQIPEFYVNGVSLAFGLFDMTLEFGLQDLPKIAPNTPLPAVITGPSNTPTVRIRLSPTLALMLSRILTRAVENYEKQNGKIPITPQLLKSIGIPNDDK